MQWKPNRSKPLIAGIPLKRPSQEQVNKAYMLFYSMIGGFASVVQTQITDVYNYARQDKKLFRMEAKKRLTPEYLKTIRTANLKRKQNEKDSKAIYQE